MFIEVEESKRVDPCIETERGVEGHNYGGKPSIREDIYCIDIDYDSRLSSRRNEQDSVTGIDHNMIMLEECSSNQDHSHKSQSDNSVLEIYL